MNAAEPTALQRLTLWDSDEEPPVDGGVAYRWNGHAEQHGVCSLLRYVEIHSERLRGRYLALIHEVGEHAIDGIRVIDHLALPNGLSYWWMTLLAEKSVYKSPAIVDALRLLAFEEIVAQRRPARLRLVSTNRTLHEVLRALCARLAVAYEWERPPRVSGLRPSARALAAAVPEPVRAAFSLVRHVFARWPLRATKPPAWSGGDQALLVCSYFTPANQPDADTGKGRYASPFWGDLPALLAATAQKPNWLHQYVEGSGAASVDAAREAALRFNRDGQGIHSFVDAYLSPGVVLKVLRQWLFLLRVSLRLAPIRHAFRARDSQLSLWPLMRQDWLASMRGPTAIRNLLWNELFDCVLRALPRQPRGLYLCENQGWERALIQAWRRYQHGQLIAVVHSTIRDWDLRYFIDSRTTQSRDPHPLPVADLVALNGKAAVTSQRASGYPADRIIECEALRYSYLDGLQPAVARTKRYAMPRVLILGDYVPSSTIKMLRLLEQAALLADHPAEFTLKPHPRHTVDPADYPSLRLRVVRDPLPAILRQFDLAYASSTTAAALDAYLAGVPVVVMLDDTGLNFSPLRGRAGARFAGTARELADALSPGSDDTSTGPTIASGEFFFLDRTLPRWHRLLSIA